MQSIVISRQLDDMDCGPASLKMIAAYYGKEYSIQTLRDYCYITREGVSMQGISEAAERIGLRTLGVRLTFDQLEKDVPLPCILHWNQQHFVVCYKVKLRKRGKEKIHIADPASGKATYHKEEFMKCWASDMKGQTPQGLALLLEPGPDFFHHSDESQKPNHRIKFFMRYFRPYVRQLFFLLSCLLAGSGIQMAFPLLTQALVDKGIGTHSLNLITLVLIAQLMLTFAQMTTDFINGWLTLRMNTKVGVAMISDFLEKLMKLPLRFFDTKNTGDIMQRISDHDRIKQLLTGSSLNIVFSVFNFIVFSAILAYYHLFILCLFLAGNTLYVLWVIYFMHYRRELDIRRFNQSAAEQQNIIQIVQGMQDIKLTGCERQKRWEWQRIQRVLYKINVRSLQLGQWQQLGQLFFSQTTNVIITFIAAKAVVEGQLTLGMMMSLTYIIGQVSAPLHNMIGFARELQDAAISMDRLDEIHQRPDEEDTNDDWQTTLPDNHDITLDHVWFSYSGARRNYALQDISLVIPAQKVTALVGASGSGKTTLIKLLLGFYDPLEGSIRIGNTEIGKIRPSTWRSNIGTVMQDGYIFSDTIARNIALGDDTIDEKRLQNAVQVANINDYIESLPLRMRTRIGAEGNGLSQGQRQRILIARAVYRSPKLIFLDEATNALDANNETIIMENLREFYRGRTVIVAAHRLSTVKDADNIVVLNHGRVVEQGTHKQLVQQRGTYYTLIKNQLELGL
ncbi:MAG: peptidase domain-containing ABC transporter [Prevotella sp.]|nr:peptidase domain-containing ABC transporter [Prevotella sp.]